jgi:hypothetical protein
MKFFYNGKKKSNEPGFASGCLLIIGFGALIFFFTLVDDIEDLKDHLIEVILVSIMGFGLLSALFAKKAQLSNRHVVIENDYLKLDKVGVPLSSIQLDVYQKGSTFQRYHLRDTSGKIAIFSILEDDLCRYFLEHHPDQTEQIQEVSAKHDGPYISIRSTNGSLYYNLESGKYTVKREGKQDVSCMPEIYAYDGKYKKGEPLLKKKS